MAGKAHEKAKAVRTETTLKIEVTTPAVVQAAQYIANPLISLIASCLNSSVHRTPNVFVT